MPLVPLVPSVPSVPSVRGTEVSLQLLKEAVDLAGGLPAEFELCVAKSDCSHDFKYSNELQSAAFALLKRNMESVYNASASMEWSDESKLAEMSNEEGYYIYVLQKSDRKLAAFTFFLVTTEETVVMDDDYYNPPDSENALNKFAVDFPVIYCMELQVQESFRNKKIGSLLLEALLQVAKRTERHRVMLTVLVGNQRAVDFYVKRGFKPDYNSPNTLEAEDSPDEEEDYLILYKPV